MMAASGVINSLTSWNFLFSACFSTSWYFTALTMLFGGGEGEGPIMTETEFPTSQAGRDQKQTKFNAENEIPFLLLRVRD
jgi:hypothetical protein